MLDVYSECDPMRHADIPPMFFVNALQKKGFKLTKKTRIGGSWSHSDAYEFFKDSGAKVLFNFDAHHDLFSEDELDCGNWLYHLQRDDKLAEVVWVVRNGPRDWAGTGARPGRSRSSTGRISGTRSSRSRPSSLPSLRHGRLPTSTKSSGS